MTSAALPRLQVSRAVWVPLLAAAFAAIALIFLSHMVREISFAEIAETLWQLPYWRLVLALACTVVSHLLLTFYDVFSLRVIGARVPWLTAARAAFTSYTLTHNLGFAALTGGSARLRIYGAAGLGAASVARIVVIAGLAFWGGVIGVAVLCLLSAKRPVPFAGTLLSTNAAHMYGLAALVCVAAVVATVGLYPPIRSRVAAVIPLPSASSLALLLTVAALDLGVAAVALAVLIPGLPVSDWPQLYLAYALAIIAGLVTHVPGGLGVFEAVFVAEFPESGSGTIAALVAYRAIYYILPLAVSLALNAAIEARGLRRQFRPFKRVARLFGDELGPLLFAVMSFAGGLVLLLSGALPALHPRMRLLTQILPLPMIEVAHLCASLVGAGLMLVAPALSARLDRGRRAAGLLLLLGAIFSLAKGLDFEEASIMLVIAGLLQAASPLFYRKAQGPFSAGNRLWLIAAALGVGLSIASGIVAYRHLPYESDLWWKFCLHGDGPRFLRASFAVGALVAGVALHRALWRTERVAGLTRLPPGVFERATAVHSRSDAALALTDDKAFLCSPEGDAFVMYRHHGDSCIVMGDPVGPQARWADLVWDLCNLADRSGSRLCFYQTSAAMLPLMIELGLKPIKYGEEAHVPTQEFSLAGPRMKGLRNSHARACREGLHLLFVPAGETAAWLERLRPISDGWLRQRGAREKTFSLGRFDESYLRHFALAVVVDRNERPVAFANLWRSGDGREQSVDLMRQAPDAPPGTMDFLFVEVVRRAARQGSEVFNLGMAPLSGVQGGKLAPMWARLANLAFSLEGWRYNFAGLRFYKEKFAPRWESRFIGLVPGLAGWRSLADLAHLINSRPVPNDARRPVRPANAEGLQPAR